LETQKLDAGPKSSPSKGQVVGNAPTLSVRQREEIAASQAGDDSFIRPEQRSSAGARTTVVQYAPSTLRSRLQKEAEAKAAAAKPALNSTAQRDRDMWDAFEKTQRDREAENRRKQIEAETQRQRDAAAAAAAEKLRNEEQGRLLAVNLMFTSTGATPYEIKTITALALANCPEQRYDSQKLWMMLMEFRSLNEMWAR
jgi:hypothetical protein